MKKTFCFVCLSGILLLGLGCDDIPLPDDLADVLGIDEAGLNDFDGLDEGGALEDL